MKLPSPRRRLLGGRSEAMLMGIIVLYVLICLSFWMTIGDTSTTTTTTTTTPLSPLPKMQWKGGLLPLPMHEESSHFILDNNDTTSHANNNHLLYTGKFGLGHRLSKLVSAYHLASQADLCPYLPEFRVQWGSCSDNENDKEQQQPQNETKVDIFAYLFGSQRLRVPCDRNPGNNVRQQQQSKTIVVRNDVLGYYAGQSYKNARVSLSRTALTLSQHAWNQKMDADRTFFAQLLQAFGRQPHGQALRDFQHQVEWKRHFVIGLHLRVGNGEQDHFVQADRGVSNTTEWCRSVATTLQCALADLQQHQQQQEQQLPVLVFVSTDTADVIAVVRAALQNHRVEVFPQARLPAQEGVSYQKWTHGEECFDGWKSAMTDMALLAESNVVVAATRSTFTQILPMSQVLAPPYAKENINKGGYKFCEVGDGGTAMTCFRDRHAWLLRQRGETTWRSSSLSSPLGQCETIVPPPMGASDINNNNNNNNNNDRIVHKVMVHLPDIQEDSLRKDAVAFLRDESQKESRFYFGPAFARKYRGGQNSVFSPDWTWAD